MALANISIHFLITLLKKLFIFYARMQYNRMQVQELYTTTRGQFVVFYIYQKSRGLMLEVILREYFSTHNKLRNDLLVRDFVRLNYHHDAKVMDPNFIRRIGKQVDFYISL